MTEQQTPEIIVIVDEEEMILTSLASLLALESDYDVRAFLSPGQALEEARNTDIDLVISDCLHGGDLAGAALFFR